MIVRELLTLLGFDLDEKGAAQYERRTEAVQKKVENTTSAIGRAWDKVSRAADAGLARMDRGLERVQSGAQGVADGLGGLAGALGGGLAFAGFADITSRMTDIQSRLTNAVEGTGESADLLRKKLLGAANAAFIPFEQAVDGFFAAKPALDEMGMSMDDQIATAVALGDMLTLAGVKGEGASRAMMWLNRTLSTGKMSGEAFSNIMETDADLLEGFREHLGMTVSEFQELGRKGIFTTKQFVGYLDQARDGMRAATGGMATTINDAFNNMRNNFEEFIFNTSEATGAAKVFADIILWFANRPAIAGTAAIGALTVGLAAMAAQAVATSIAAVRAFAAMTAGLIRMGIAAAMNPVTWIILGVVAAAAALALAIQDVYTWINGGDSVIGAWLGSWEDFSARIVAEWNAAWSNIKAGFAKIGQVFNDAVSAIGDWFAPIIKPVTDAMTWLFGDNGDLANAILLAIPGAAIIAAFAKLWDALPDTVKGKAAAIFQPIKDAWEWVIGWLGAKWDAFWNGLGAPVRWAIEKFTSAGEEARNYGTQAGPGGVPMAPGQQGAIGTDGSLRQVSPQMPAHADGTRSAGRGLAIVGENGPEVVRFGGGEQVIPAAPSSRMLEKLAANARGFAQRAADFGDRFATDFAGMQGRVAAPGLAAGGATPNPATGLNPVGGTLAATVNVGGISVEVTAAETGGMSPEALGDLVAKRVKGEMAGVAEGVFAKEIRRATRHFTEQE